MEKRYCENCKEELKEDDKFCQNCGTKVKDVEIKKTIEEDKKDEKVETPIEKSENEIKVSNSEEQKKKIVIYGIIVTILLVIVSSALLFFILNDGDKSKSNDKKDVDTEEKDDKNDDNDKDDDTEEKSDKDDDDKDNEDENKKDDESEEDNKLEDFVLQEFDNGNIIDFYYGSSYIADNTVYSINKPDYTSKSKGKIRIENKDCEIFDNFYRFDSNGKVISNITLYRDGDKLKIYDSELNEGLILKLDSNYERYNMLLIPNSSEPYTINNIFGIGVEDGIVYTEDESFSVRTIISNIKLSFLYDIRKEKELFKNQNYYNFRRINNSKLIQAYKGYGENQEAVILSLDNKKELMSVKSKKKNRRSMGFSGYGEHYITFSEYDYLEGTPCYVNLYTSDLKPILNEISNKSLYEIASDRDFLFFSLYEDYLFYRENDTIHKYDNKGNEIKKYKYDKVLDVIGNLFLVVENGSLLLKDDKSLSIVLGEWKDSYKYHEVLSGYYNADPQVHGYYNVNNKLYKENEKKEGVYLIVETNRDKENWILSGIEYYYNIDTKKIEKTDLQKIQSREGYYE